ncbi:MAG: elongation factor G [Oscillospiraceae bacterium]|nr:elongation factor G [Oscillospiraceae bacterium]
MKQYKAQDIVNVALVGRGSSGMTSLAEAMIYIAGGSDRLGKVSDGNTVMDFDPEEIKRKASISIALAPIEWKEKKINILDTPGLFDFKSGEAEGIRAADTALVVVNAKSGSGVGTEKAFRAARRSSLSRIFIVNGLCDESVDFYGILSGLKDTFGQNVCPIFVPVVKGGKAECYVNILTHKAYTYSNGKAAEVALPEFNYLDEYMDALKEAVAESDEELLEKYFGGEEFTEEEILRGVRLAVKDGALFPVICVDAITLAGIEQMMDLVAEIAPNALKKAGEIAQNEDGEDVSIAVDEDAPTSAIIFKTVADPFVGKLSYFKVISGKVSPETPLVNMRTGENERITKVLIVKGKKQEECAYIGAGDIGAIPKLSDANTGDTLCSPKRKVILSGIRYPHPTFKMAIYPKKKGEEDKVAQGMARLVEEDPTLEFVSDKETHEMVVTGLGDQQLDVVVSKLKSKFNVEVTLKVPKVAYREAIRKKVQVQGRHKKQSGGAGQFGDVWIEFEPCDAEGLEFGERVVGGSVPKNFFPAVEKGLLEAINKGPLAGYPVVGLKATLYDGSYHPVDSNEMAFKMAAKIAYKNGMAIAAPTLLEPYGTLRAAVSDAHMGDIMGEVNKRRGRILGMSPGEDGMQIVEAEVPMAEMHDFNTFIRQATQGRGTYTFEFVRYEDAPSNVAQKVIENAKQDSDE